MKVVNKLNCKEGVKVDENIEHTPILQVIGEINSVTVTNNRIKLQIDLGDMIEVDGHVLIKAIKNAMNV